MVVGQVQSGKTANYIGLICKAADAGYRLIIVLAGMHNSLRSQTQSRLDEGFLGRDTRKHLLFGEDNVRIGVGRLPGHKYHIAHSLTSSAENGDFTISGAAKAGVVPGGSESVLLVVKKNASVLKNLISWATRIGQRYDPETNSNTVKDVPLLLIDDEADNASVNTRAVPIDENGNIDPDYNPTRINSLIRQLLRSFQQTAYVGYTATPFANIFIPQDLDAEDFGEDLFPRSFIINLPTPSNHVGPVQVFGLSGDNPEGSSDGMPIIRTVDDQENWVPDGHKNHHSPGPLPNSLKEAVRAFILVCAGRMVRGQDRVHNSMLVHVTRFTSVQREVARQVSEELRSIRNRLRYGDGDARPAILDEMRDLWEQDFVATSEVVPEVGFPSISWSEVKSKLVEASSRIEVLEINGTARDVLQYSEHPEGFSCIAVGGDKLSRGLTLEGLSVSYYLRASRMYDTLMQMGRWFGYRHGYADLCRLYTTADLSSWYRDITAASEELRREFDRMAASNGTPADYGLLVRKHPGSLIVTAAAKMRSGTAIQITFSRQLVQTLSFDLAAPTLRTNMEALENLIGTLDDPVPSGKSGTRIWKGVDADDVLMFLDTYSTHRDARKAQASLLARYIRDRVKDDELTEWTVILASGRGSAAEIAGYHTTLVERNAESGSANTDPSTHRIGTLISPSDEALDLDTFEMQRAKEETRRVRQNKGEQWNENELPGGISIRSARSARRGLLMLYPVDPEVVDLQEEVPAIAGFAISFPASKGAPVIEYVINETYWGQEFAIPRD